MLPYSRLRKAGKSPNLLIGKSTCPQQSRFPCVTLNHLLQRSTSFPGVFPLRKMWGRRACLHSCFGHLPQRVALSRFTRRDAGCGGSGDVVSGTSSWEYDATPVDHLSSQRVISGREFGAVRRLVFTRRHGATALPVRDGPKPITYTFNRNTSAKDLYKTTCTHGAHKIHSCKNTLVHTANPCRCHE